MRTKGTIAILASIGLLITITMFPAANHARPTNVSDTASAGTYQMVIPHPRSATLASSERDVSQLDPGARNYILETFTINSDSLDVMVTRTADGRYLAGKEYWKINESMLSAIAGATSGTSMTISGGSHNWPAPTGFTPAFPLA